MSKDNIVYLGHILNCVLKIQEYMKGITLEQFINNDEKQDAVVRNFEVIGEATSRISDEFKIKNNQLPWRKMKAMRNFLIHDYEEVDLKLVWEAIMVDLPELKTNIEKIIN